MSKEQKHEAPQEVECGVCGYPIRFYCVDGDHIVETELDKEEGTTTKNFNVAVRKAKYLHAKYKRAYFICQRTRDQVYEVHSDAHVACWGIVCFNNAPIICVIA